MPDQIDHDQVVGGIGLPPDAQYPRPGHRARGATGVGGCRPELGNRESEPEAGLLPGRQAGDPARSCSLVTS